MSSCTLKAPLLCASFTVFMPLKVGVLKVGVQQLSRPSILQQLQCRLEGPTHAKRV